MYMKENVLFNVADHPTPKISKGEIAFTLESRDYKNAQCVITQNYIEVEMETLKRKYEVNIPKLIECLNQHRNMSILEIAEKLDKPKTMVEHWFRKDKYFAIPDADIWMQLKSLLGIETTEFDESIMTFEVDVGKYDMAGRIYTGETSPTILTESQSNLYLIPHDSNENKYVVALENQPTDSRIKILEDGVIQTLTSRMGTGGNNTPMVMEGINGDQAGTLDSNYYKGCGERQGTEREVVCVGNGQLAQLGLHEKAHTLDCMHDQQAVLEHQYDNLTVRRLTPTECSRLQGYPDGWMDIGEWRDSKGKLHKESDAPKYKAAGNSIALPFWQWLMFRISEQLKKDEVENPTMASLFDGISGFPLCGVRAGITPIWSSEIEEFPMAVAEKHFGENGDLAKFL